MNNTENADGALLIIAKPSLVRHFVKSCLITTGMDQIWVREKFVADVEQIVKKLAVLETKNIAPMTGACR